MNFQQNFHSIFKNSLINVKLIEFPNEFLNSEDKIEYNKKNNIIKKMYNLIFPSIQIEYDSNKININKEILNKFFSDFGEIKYFYVFTNKILIFYKYYFSSILAFDTLNENLNEKSNNNNNLENIFYEEIEKNINLNLNNLIEISNEEKSNEKNQIFIQKNKEINLLNKILIWRAIMINIIKTYKNFFNYNNNNNTLNINFTEIQNKKNKISFNTKQNSNYILKFVTNYQIQIENDEEFNVKERILGKNGFFLKKIIYESCTKFNDFSTKIRLRGKGSGYKERKNFIESKEPLQLSVSSLSYFNYLNCCVLIEILLKKIYKDYANFIKTKVSFKLKNNIQEKKILKYCYVVDRFGNFINNFTV